MTISAVPEWVQDELNAPAMEGGRNDQMISVGPTLLRCGHTVDSLFELFRALYPDDVSDTEILTTCRSATKYAAREDNALAKGKFAKWRRHLDELRASAAGAFDKIQSRYAWSLANIEDMNLATWTLPEQRYGFIQSLFKPTDIIWIGEVWQTGERETRGGRKVNFATHFKPAREWLAQPVILGSFVSHCTFKPRTNSRSNEAVDLPRFLVVESDILEPDQLVTILRYLSDYNGLTLRAIVDTGGRSIHGWFDLPKEVNAEGLEEWGAILRGLKCDPSTLRPSQPVRLPGCLRAETKRPQQLLYLA
jgi:hypothetical protein